MAKRTVERDEPPSTKKRPKRDCHFDMAWIQDRSESSKSNVYVTVIAAARLIAIQTKEQLARITKYRGFVFKVT